MSMPLRPGDPAALGRYELVGRLGEGGMGAVYLGRDSDGGRLVAIKMVRPEFAHETEFRGRFRSEVNRAKQVPSFSTAEVLDADPDHEPPYLVVEYVDGPSLAMEIRERGPLSGAALQSVAVGIATALTAIHGAGVIHRDLKPGNVLFARGGIKVIDFGIARAFEATSQHTRTDQMVGTVSYMAPERFDPVDGRPVTAAADIFAWGAVMVFAATGRTPFAADSAAATAMRILTQEPNLTGVPEPLRGLVERTLAKEPGDRPTARELLDALLAGEAPRPAAITAPAAEATPVRPEETAADVTPVPVGRARRGRTTTLIAAAAAVLAAAGVGAAIRFLPNEGQEAAGPGPGSSASLAPRPSVTTKVLTAAEKLDGIRRGQRKTLIHVAEINKDLALDDNDYEIQAGDGTGARSEFTLIPMGTGFLIRSLQDPKAAEEENCLGVQLDPDASADVVRAECFLSVGTLFQIEQTGRKDDRGRPTFTISSEKYGFLQWNGEKFYVELLGDAPPASTFSFVDRGPLPSASPS
ncbi:serine/threonine protein kinase [Actinoplanes utahensis]|uniref:Serine/threonine protein kinase n=2 Tax=Actinoplanes utahensis TaxID=1869 RepID=A0A0A6UI55_ACTUT|nr:serine/threonine protein kinase [Actinoplanes utahensis]